MSKSMAVAAAFFAASLTLSGAASAATLLQNGSFENGTTGWTTGTGPGVELHDGTTGPTIAPQDGSYYAELDSTANSSMYQMLSLTTGKYLLSFWYSPASTNMNSNGIGYWLSGITNGSVSSYTPGAAIGSWLLVELEFVVTKAVPFRLTFDAPGTSDGSGGLLDNIQIASIPVPASGAALLAGLGGLAALRRRRKAA